jgi:uncharacterized iron-regulated protein
MKTSYLINRIRVGRILALVIVFQLLCLKGWAQAAPEAYRLYDSKGNPVTYEKMLKDLAKQDVVFVGEMHNCVISHWLELCILKSLHQFHGKQLAVGMEMLESDNQIIIDEYQKGQITSERFEDEMRLWPNYSTDYEPLVDFTCEQNLPLVATNVPRRYANAVKNHGIDFLDSLSDEAKRYLPPLPISYQQNEQAGAAFGLMAQLSKGKKSNPEWLSQSQAVKDATMAWNIALTLNGGAGKKAVASHLIHFNGNYHTDSGEGIPTYLKQYAPKLSFKSIYAVRQDDITALDEYYLGHGDYYICVPSDMVTSY